MCYSMESLRKLAVLTHTMIVIVTPAIISGVSGLGVPSFRSPIENITVAVGREAVLACAVENLEPYKVAWLKVDTQTILTIHNHVITKNNRIGILHSQNNIWELHIKDVREYDQGWYMCQINTDPMKSQTGHLTVVVPPDILDYPTSADMIVDEGANVTFQCIAKGSPTPKVTWKREDGRKIDLEDNTQVSSVTGSVFSIINVKRHHMGAYLCIASNGVPPTISKRIKLIVHFAPTIWIKYQLIGAYDGQTVVLECHSQAYPKSINYWTKDTGEILSYGKYYGNNKYIPEIIEDGYNVYMKLKINSLELNDYGVYKCVSKNSVADMEGSINIYRIPDPDKLLLGKRKPGRHNASIIGSARVSDEALMKNNYNVTYKKITAERDQLNLQGYYSSNSICRFSFQYVISTALLCIIFAFS